MKENGLNLNWSLSNLIRIIMKRLQILLLLVSVLCLGVRCKDKTDPDMTLPKATQEGKQAAGCLVNGQVYVADMQFSWSVGSSDVDWNTDGNFVLSLIKPAWGNYKTKQDIRSGYISRPAHGE